MIKAFYRQTDVICIKLDSVSANIEVEVFDETGALRNPIAGLSYR